MENSKFYGQIGFAIKALQNQIKRCLDKQITAVDGQALTGLHAMVLSFLLHNRDRDVFQRDIEATFNIRRSTATGTLQLMENNGLITRCPVCGDGRLKKIVLTEKALRLSEIVEEQLDVIENRMAQALSDAEREQLMDYLARIHKAIEE